MNPPVAHAFPSHQFDVLGLGDLARDLQDLDQWINGPRVKQPLASRRINVESRDKAIYPAFADRPCEQKRRRALTLPLQQQFGAIVQSYHRAWFLIQQEAFG